LLASSRALLSRNDSVLVWRTVCNGIQTVVRGQLFAGQLIATRTIRADNFIFKYGCSTD